MNGTDSPATKAQVKIGNVPYQVNKVVVYKEKKYDKRNKWTVL